MKNLLTVILILLAITSCNRKNRIAEIGKQVPDYTFMDILNSHKKTISIRDLKGRVVIIEFWATWCSPCLPAMKKLDSLKEVFKDDLEIITVSMDDKKRLEQYIETSKTKLQVAYDTIHHNIFEYQIIPHSIIMDKNGIVRAITSPENITKKVIQELLTNNKIELEYKNDFVKDTTNLRVLKSINNFKYQLNLTSYNPAKRGSWVNRSPDGTINGKEYHNRTLPSLFQDLFNAPSYKRIVFKDGLTDKDFEYKKENQFSLVINVSKGYEDKIDSIGVNFINNYFDVNARKSTKKLDCYILKNIGSILKKSNSEKPDYMFMGSIFKMKKQEIDKLTRYLENFTSIPVINQTDLNDKYDIELDWQEENPQTLHKELQKYGLKLEKSKGKILVDIVEIYLNKSLAH